MLIFHSYASFSRGYPKKADSDQDISSVSCKPDKIMPLFIREFSGPPNLGVFERLMLRSFSTSRYSHLGYFGMKSKVGNRECLGKTILGISGNPPETPRNL